jgi:hypothetical protein
LFADPTFDGDPVQIYEPTGDQSPVPPDEEWSARLEMCQWIRETLDKESIWDEARSTNLSRW